MNLKQLLTVTLATLILNSNPADAQTVVNSFAVDPLTSDMALIYMGDPTTRPVWNKTAFKPHVVHSYADGRDRTWFFDSFLFLEFSYKGRRIDNSAGTGATQTDWEDLFKFQMGLTNSNEGMLQLDDYIETLKQSLGEPAFGKHKIVMQLPTAHSDQTNWGTVSGQPMNFTKEADRVTAMKWGVDKIVELWNSCKFKNLELVGVYCVDENMNSVGSLFKAVSPYIHQKGLKLYWIPYYTNNPTKNTWADNGVDVAYQQPNYYFNKNIYKTQLKAAIGDAKKYGLGLELEFHPDALWDYNRTSDETDNSVPSKASFYTRLKDYIDEFENYGVFENSAIAYYSGNNGFNKFYYSETPQDAELMDRLAALIDKRHTNNNAGLNSVLADKADNNFVIAGKGFIQIAATTPNAAVYNICGSLIHKGSGKINCRPGIYIVTDGRGHSRKIMIR